jgi:hypothetical protein
MEIAPNTIRGTVVHGSVCECTRVPDVFGLGDADGCRTFMLMDTLAMTVALGRRTHCQLASYCC